MPRWRSPGGFTMPPDRASYRLSATGRLRDSQIDAVLPRRSKFSRKTPFTEVSEQVLVANVDVAFLVMSFDGSTSTSVGSSVT